MSYLLQLPPFLDGPDILIVWPQEAGAAWMRERVLRTALPGWAKAVLECYICLSFWSGLALSPLWWLNAAASRGPSPAA